MRQVLAYASNLRVSIAMEGGAPPSWDPYLKPTDTFDVDPLRVSFPKPFALSFHHCEDG